MICKTYVISCFGECTPVVHKLKRSKSGTFDKLNVSRHAFCRCYQCVSQCYVHYIHLCTTCYNKSIDADQLQCYTNYNGVNITVLSMTVNM